MYKSVRARRPGLVRLLLVIALTLLVGSTPVFVGPATATSQDQWGAYAARRPGESHIQAVQRLESLAGRGMAQVRSFYLWDSLFPGQYEQWLRDTGHGLVMSVKTRRADGTPINWAALAAARPGSSLHNEMVRWADRVKSYGGPVYVTLMHEPEARVNQDMGTAEEFKAAWRAWVSVFQSRGVTNAKYMWIMTDYSFWVPSTDRRRAEKWYPGDDVVHAMGVDAYNWFNCREGISTPWRSLRELIEPQRQFWLGHTSEELWVTEYGTVEDPANPNRKAQWYAEARELFKTSRYAPYHGQLLFEGGSPATCHWRPDTSSAAASGWRSWGLDPYYAAGQPAG